jgi:hypothetical protein
LTCAKRLVILHTGNSVLRVCLIRIFALEYPCASRVVKHHFTVSHRELNYGKHEQFHLVDFI